jgi:signal peptidase I
MNTEFQEGDLVWVNKYAKSYSSELIIHRKAKQMSLLEEFSILGIVVSAYSDLCYVWVMQDEEYHYFFKEDLKCQE